MKDFTQTPLGAVVQDAKTRRYPKGQIILYEGEHPSDVFIIKKGAVKIYDIDDDGNEKILHILKTPAIFPAVFFFGKAEQTNTFYTTVVESEVYVLSRQDFEDQVMASPQLAAYCMRWFAAEVMEILKRMSSLEKTSIRDKLLAVLSYLARRYAVEKRNGWWRVSFPVSHQLLADMIGVTRESTTMVMKELQKEKLVRNPRLSVLDIKLQDIQA